MASTALAPFAEGKAVAAPRSALTGVPERGPRPGSSNEGATGIEGSRGPSRAVASREAPKVRRVIARAGASSRPEAELTATARAPFTTIGRTSGYAGGAPPTISARAAAGAAVAIRLRRRGRMRPGG